MIRAKDIQTALLSLVGWQQSYNTSDVTLSPTLVESDSGLYFQQVHPLLTLSNLESIAPDFKNTNYEEYTPENEYLVGNVVQFKEHLYKALLPSTGVEPSSSAKYWGLTSPFSEWLEEKTKASIHKAVMRFCKEKINNGTAKALCESRTLFDGTGRIVDTEPNRKNLVGFEIVPIRSRGVTTKINKIGLQFTEPGDYTLYLMHSSMDVPVRIITCKKIRKNSMEWFDFDDLFLPYQSSNNDAGGSWYLCYFQTDLPKNSQAIVKNKDWSKSPCRDCNRSEYNSWLAWSRYLEVHSFYVNEEVVNGVQFNDDFSDDFAKTPLHLWDIQNNQYIYDSNYGINLEVTVECDVSDFIISQRPQFTDVIMLQVAVDMLREFMYNPNVRTNRHSINASRTEIAAILDGDAAIMKTSGLSFDLDKAYKALSISTAGIDRVCMPCKNNGIKYRTV